MPESPETPKKRGDFMAKKMNIPEEGIYDARVLGKPRMLMLGFQHMCVPFRA